MHTDDISDLKAARSKTLSCLSGISVLGLVVATSGPTLQYTEL